MTRTEWQAIFARLQAKYPLAALPVETEAEWVTHLEAFDAAEVWQAIQRCVERRPKWLLDPVMSIWEEIDALNKERRDRERIERQLTGSNENRGIPIPPRLRKELEAQGLLKPRPEEAPTP